MTTLAGKLATQKTILSALPATAKTAYYRVSFCPSVVRRQLLAMLKSGAVEVVELEDGKRRVFAPTQAGCERFSLPMPEKKQTPAQTLTACWMGFKSMEKTYDL